jgi:hypothetical protein
MNGKRIQLLLAVMIAASMIVPSLMILSGDATATSTPITVLNTSVTIQNNNTSSNGCLVRMPNGTLWCFFWHSASEYANTGTIGYQKSYDNGMTWNPAYPAGTQYTNFTSYADLKFMPLSVTVGYRVYVFYVDVKSGGTNFTEQMRYTNNNGSTWSAAQTIWSTHNSTFFWGACSALYLNGHYILAAYDAPGNADWCVYSITTTNPLGAWTQSNKLYQNATGYGLAEPDALMEESNGSAMMVIRSKSTYLQTSFSTDYGLTWSAAHNSAIHNGDDPFAMAQNGTHDYYLIWNNKSTSANVPRNPLYVAQVTEDLSAIIRVSELDSDAYRANYQGDASHQFGNPTTGPIILPNGHLVVGYQNYSHISPAPRRADWIISVVEIVPPAVIIVPIIPSNGYAGMAWTFVFLGVGVIFLGFAIRKTREMR